MAASKGNEADAPRDDERNSSFGGFWSEPAYAPASESSIKDYSLQAFLGEGSTAHVYLATRIDTHDLVAIKVIDKLLVRQAQMAHKVQREILLHSPLRHRHVVRVREAFEDARNHYIVLEYCEGGSVASLVRSRREKRLPMDENTVKNIFRQTALGVSYLHERGIIHRDLKLSNLLLTNEGDVKISDFGLATLVSDEHGTVCGTPNFIAPEVLSAREAEGSPYDQTADIWSLGCILYTLLLGKPPFEGFKVSDTLANVSNAGRQPLHFPSGFSAKIGDLITRMLSRDATARPTIKQVLGHQWLRAPTPTNDKRHPPHRSHEPILEASTRTKPMRRPADIPTKSLRRRSVGTAQKSASNTVSRFDFKSSDSESGFSGLEHHSILPKSSEEEDADSDEDSVQLESSDGFSSNFSLELMTRSQTPPAASQPSEGGVGRDKRDAQEPLPRPLPPTSVTRVEAAMAAVKEVHFLRLLIQVSDLPFVGIGPDVTSEIAWDCWETSDIRQLTRFTLRVQDSEFEYVPSKAVIQSTTSALRHVFVPATTVSTSVASNDDDPRRVVRLCQCLASRALQLRRAAMATDVDNLPMIHYDRLPKSLLDSLRRESVRATLVRELGHTTKSPDVSGRDAPSGSRCVLPGVGLGEFDADGRLVIHFFSGPRLQMSPTGSTIRYCRAPGEQEDEFDLARTPFLPTEVKKHFEHVPAFIRRLQSH